MELLPFGALAELSPLAVPPLETSPLGTNSMSRSPYWALSCVVYKFDSLFATLE